MKLLNNLLTGFLKNREDFTFEDKVALLATYYLCILGIVSVFANIALHLGIQTTLLCGISSIVLTFGFIYGRFYKKITFCKWVLALFLFFFCNGYWLVNYGSHGSGLYAFVMYICVIAIIWNKPLYIVVLILLNIFILFLIDINNPGLIPNYPSDNARITDSYITLLIGIGLVVIILITSKNNYIKQYKLAQKSDELKTIFIQNISHEIRTPLNAIMGFISVVTKHNLTLEKQKYYEGLIYENGTYLMRLVSDMMEFSVIDTGILKISPTPLDINECFQKLYADYQKVILDSKKAIELVMNIPPQPVFIETDKARLEKIATNLLSNAVKFSLEGKIEFGFSLKPNNEILFYVSDTGIGIKDEFKPYIFRRFVSFKNDVDIDIDDHKARGAGIGLALTKELVGALGGKIWYSSTYSKGSTFYFTLPVKVHCN